MLQGISHRNITPCQSPASSAIRPDAMEDTVLIVEDDADVVDLAAL